MPAPLEFLADYPIKTFMQDDWQKRPKLFKRAFPNFEPLCSIETVFEMAQDEDIESRLITRKGDQWELQKGPLEQLPNLNKPDWTLLIQGLDLVLPEAHEFLQQFRFVPDARLDDIMLSLASDGGGVGPHYDSYDVFLVQMHGRRNWKIGPLKNRNLIADSALKILSDFEPHQEFVVEPGDVLYLPPGYGHDGQAEGVCSTLSVGFRALNKAELLSHLLREMADQVERDSALTETLFSDPGRGLQKNPSEIPQDLIDFAAQTMNQFRPQKAEIERHLGILLSEPKPYVYFQANESELGPEETLDTLREKGLCLAMGTRMLFKGEQCFVNGDPIQLTEKEALKSMKQLAKASELTPEETHKALENDEFKYFIAGFAKAGWLNTLE